MRQRIRQPGRLRNHPPHPARGLLLTVAVAVTGSLLLIGCNEGTRYRVLSFFFDGVPPPPGVTVPKTIIGPWGVELGPDDPRAQKYLRSAASRPAGLQTSQPVWFQHTPYRKRRCEECHSEGSSYETIPAAKTCRKCHQPYRELQADDWAHGPVALGRCDLCHVVSHKSKHRGLLTKAVPELCLDCHDRTETLSRPYHAVASGQACSQCHDPHLAGNRLLLVDSTTYKRRARQAKIAPSKHAAWPKTTCVQCHVAEQSNRLVADVDRVCLTCHEKVRRPSEGPPLHEAVREGKCLTCHAPHRSTRPHLVRAVGEKMCVGCHKPEQMRVEAHPPMQRADCLLCHTGHSSPDGRLLNPLGKIVRQHHASGLPRHRRRGP